MSRGRQSIDITGQRFHRLVAIRMTAKSSVGPPQRGERWLFKCVCRNEIEADKHNVKRGHIRSCGCLHDETVRQNGRQRATHGHARDGLRSPEYRSFGAMLARCNNPNHKKYKYYGGSGITVCERWANSFENFLADNGPKPSPEHEIDRWPDRDGNYEPGNTRWATRVEQNNNRFDNRRIAMAGEIHTAAEWCRGLGVTRRILFDRTERWSPEILTQWVRIRREQNPNAAMGASLHT